MGCNDDNAISFSMQYFFLEWHFTWDVKSLNVWAFDKNLKFYVNVGVLFTENHSYLHRYINVIYISISYFQKKSIST